MKELLRLIGLTLISFAAVTQVYSLKTGILAGVFVFGFGIVIDSLKK